jgi:L-ascorbate metabolism protein UlaG (beta-lactamase superfamily)
MHEALAAIPRQFPELDLALLHLGGTRILGVLLTMDAEQGVEAVRLFDADTSIPIHYDDYTVFKSPLADFRRAVAEAGLEDRVAYLDRGDTYDFEVPAERLP